MTTINTFNILSILIKTNDISALKNEEPWQGVYSYLAKLWITLLTASHEKNSKQLIGIICILEQSFILWIGLICFCSDLIMCKCM